jgi:hypothetical protein
VCHKEVEREDMDWIHAAQDTKHRKGPSSSVKGGEFLYQLSDYQFLRKDPASWS